MEELKNRIRITEDKLNFFYRMTEVEKELLKNQLVMMKTMMEINENVYKLGHKPSVGRPG